MQVNIYPYATNKFLYELNDSFVITHEKELMLIKNKIDFNTNSMININNMYHNGYDINIFDECGNKFKFDEIFNIGEHRCYKKQWFNFKTKNIWFVDSDDIVCSADNKPSVIFNPFPTKDYIDQYDYCPDQIIDLLNSYTDFETSNMQYMNSAWRKGYNVFIKNKDGYVANINDLTHKCLRSNNNIMTLWVATAFGENTIYSY